MASGSRGGRTALLADSPLAAFHSRYDPLREAARHLDAVLSGRRPSVIFILGGGLNYLAAVAADRFPRATLVSLQPSDIFDSDEREPTAIRWSPSSETPLCDVIAAAVADNRMAGGVAVVEWPPVVSRFESASERIRSVLRDALEAASSDSATTGYWAARWLRNSVRFAMAVSREGAIVPGDGPVVLACAGPGLEAAMSDVRRLRDDAAIWALASAVPALLKAGLRPDVAISTDPGFWNGAHLRAARDADIPIAMPPSAFASGETLAASTIIPLDTGLPFERMAIRAAGLSCERTSAAGSAAGSALALALRMTSGRIMLAGYDLASLGLQEHCRPYAFDILDETRSSRLSPALAARSTRVYGAYPEPAGAWRRSRAFSAYAATIRAPAADDARVFRSGASPVDTGIRRGGFEELSGASGKPPSYVTASGSGRRSGQETLAAVDAELTALADRSIADALAAVRDGSPVPYEATLFYKALAPMTAAPLLAGAARGEATDGAARAADSAAREAARRLTAGAL